MNIYEQSRKIKDLDERRKGIVKALKANLEDVRIDVNAAVVDYANERNHDAQKELRRAINTLDRIIMMQLNDEAYTSL